MSTDCITSFFTCNKCHKSRSENLRVIDRKYCLVCESHRANQSTKEPRTYAENERSFFYRQRLQTEGKFCCPKCSGEFPLSEKKRYGCKNCHSRYKIAKSIDNRKKYAGLKGRQYLTRDQYRSSVMVSTVVSGAIWYLKPCNKLERAMDRAAYLNAVDALRWWLKEGATDEYVERWFAAAGKPWSNPRLSEAEQYRVRYRTCSQYQVHERMRRQINKKLKRDGIGDIIRASLCRGGGSNAVEQRLGYTIAQLAEHIESLFTDGMTWQAFRLGQIHIDHVIPQAAFDLSDDEQWRACWSITNLQPMWARDNLAKSDRMLCGTLARHLKQKVRHDLSM